MQDRLKIVVVDENEERINEIRHGMPDYIDVVFSRVGEGAKNLIRPDAAGKMPDLVVLDAEDEKGIAPSLFAWMKTGEAGIELLPVLLLCEDAFSDEALSFLEYGDAEFFDGIFDVDFFFMKAMEMIEEVQMAPDFIEEPSYTEKMTDRIQGHSVKPQGENEDTIRRSIVLQHDEQLKQLDQAIERGKKKQEKIKEIMTLALKYKEEIREEEEIRHKQAEAMEAVQTKQEKDAGSAAFLHNLNGANVERMLSEPEEDNRRTVVVIDHDPKNRKLCELFLQSDYRVVLLHTGMSAIDYFIKAKADLLLISFEMPVLDGLKILDSIRWQPNGKKIPVIYMTEDDPDQVRKQCQKERVVGLLTKPVSKKALKRSVDAVLSTLK